MGLLKDTGIMENFKGIDLQAIMLMILNKDKVNIILKMVIYIKVNIERVLDLVKEYSN